LHMQSWADWITDTHEFSFCKQQAETKAPKPVLKFNRLFAETSAGTRNANTSGTSLARKSPVAQCSEHAPDNRLVGSSSPPSPTTQSRANIHWPSAGHGQRREPAAYPSCHAVPNCAEPASSEPPFMPTISHGVRRRHINQYPRAIMRSWRLPSIMPPPASSLTMSYKVSE
jgi:hypothetical protein